MSFERPCDRTFYWTATRGEDFHREDRPGVLVIGGVSRDDSTVPT